METLQLPRPAQEFYVLCQVLLNNVVVFKKGNCLPQVKDEKEPCTSSPFFSRAVLAQTAPNPSIKTEVKKLAVLLLKGWPLSSHFLCSDCLPVPALETGALCVGDKLSVVNNGII